MKRNAEYSIVLYISVILLLLIFLTNCAMAETVVNIYSKPNNKSMIECIMDNGDKRQLVIDNNDLESYIIIDWFDRNCTDNDRT